MELVAFGDEAFHGIEGRLMHRMPGLGQPAQDVRIDEIRSFAAAGVDALAAVIDGDGSSGVRVHPGLKTPSPRFGRLFLRRPG